MAYRDARLLADKVIEHRIWNTLEIECDSAAVELSLQLIAGIKALKPSYSVECLNQAFRKAAKEKDAVTIIGLIRLVVFCARETPNRFKAVFPAFLIQKSLAQSADRAFQWNGAPAKKSANIQVEDLASIIERNDKAASIAIKDFITWASDAGGEAALCEVVQAQPIQVATMECIAERLAQGADTNRRGHGATDLVKARLLEWGISPDLRNTNSSDVPVKDIVPAYTGPRKYDTVIWNALHEPVAVSQSQHYGSDVGSIQGKTVEEDDRPNSALLAEFPNVTILTNTEGLGCHTTMLSRLKQVLSSNIHGFIQLKTLDIKLRNILREGNCTTLIDFECALLYHKGEMDSADLINFLLKDSSRLEKEIRVALEMFKSMKLLQASPANKIALRKDRADISAYYFAVDQLVTQATPLEAQNPPYWRIGGLSKESAVSERAFKSIIQEAALAGQVWGNATTGAIEKRLIERGVVLPAFPPVLLESASVSSVLSK